MHKPTPQVFYHHPTPPSTHTGTSICPKDKEPNGRSGARSVELETLGPFSLSSCLPLHISILPLQTAVLWSLNGCKVPLLMCCKASHFKELTLSVGCLAQLACPSLPVASVDSGARRTFPTNTASGNPPLCCIWTKAGLRKRAVVVSWGEPLAGFF